MHVVGTAGHVDHGKSTLVTALTGIDPDRFEEEKRRGLTIDLGFAWCTLPSGAQIGIVDVPGHERFIRNMLAGVGSIDAALFVVAADEGWMPQSAEHLQILDFLDVRRGVVAVTKSDLVDDEMLAIVEEDVREQLASTTLADAPVIPVSATTGDGLDDLRDALDRVLEAAGPPADRGRPRLFVDRSFTITGAGTVVTGTLTGGRLAVGDDVVILPDGLRARIRSLQTHRAAVEEAVPGSRVAANLVGLERREVRRGDVLVTEHWLLSDRFAARLRAASDLEQPLEERGAYELYAGSAQTLCRLKFLEGGAELAPGASTLVEVFCDGKLPLIPDDRFVVRDVGRWETVAGGIVIDQAPPRLRRGDEESIASLRAREGLAGADLAAWMITDRHAIEAEELRHLTGVGADHIGEAIDRAAESATGKYVIARGHQETLERNAADVVGGHHAGHPLAPGIPIEELRRALGLAADLFDELILRWQKDGVVVREGAVVRLPHHGAALTPEQRSVADRALDQLRAAGASPPELAKIGLTHDLAKVIERTGEIVFLTPEIAYAADVWLEIERRVVGLIASGGPATVAQVRDAVATSRKYAVPLLERLDATGVTRRRGDLRELGPRGRELAAS